MGENEYGESGHLSNFTLLKHLMMLLKYTFFRASFVHLTKDTNRAMQLRFLKVKSLLNNAFIKDVYVYLPNTIVFSGCLAIGCPRL